ncbi:hypothetical protein BV133_1552 [Blastochloris viridis]|uniref:Uncharacterized protein n=1 Tax=Blastochloris viridis TaxID=1079 RepID=A0A182D138_BLAVI|nr:hypothetical protein BV133_1552 [Blastochloris viridis]
MRVHLFLLTRELESGRYCVQIAPFLQNYACLAKGKICDERSKYFLMLQIKKY